LIVGTPDDDDDDDDDVDDVDSTTKQAQKLEILWCS
jgi:hypothetical protein